MGKEFEIHPVGRERDTLYLEDSSDKEGPKLTVSTSPLAGKMTFSLSAILDVIVAFYGRGAVEAYCRSRERADRREKRRRR